jgi:long-chain acyl-CoA synthetase
MDNTIISELKKLTLPQILAKRAERIGMDGVAIREKAYGIWQTYSWTEYFEFVRKTGLGLKSLGFRRGDHIGIIMDNHSEWLFSELGGQAVGAVTLNLFTSSVSDELANILNRIRASYVFAEDQEQVDKLLEAREKLSTVKKVIFIDPTGMRSYEGDDWLISFRALLERGDELDKAKPELFEAELWKGKSNDIAHMIMTSGTTGISKLAMLSHSNFNEMACKWLDDDLIGHETNWLSISPPAWIVDQMWLGVALMGGR